MVVFPCLCVVQFGGVFWYLQPDWRWWWRSMNWTYVVSSLKIIFHSCTYIKTLQNAFFFSFLLLFWYVNFHFWRGESWIFIPQKSEYCTALLKRALINTFIHQKDLRVYVKFSNKIRFLTRRTIPPKKIKKMEISPWSWSYQRMSDRPLMRSNSYQVWWVGEGVLLIYH